MKMFFRFIVILVIIPLGVARGQVNFDQADKYYQKGMKMLNAKKYREADSLLSLSASYVQTTSTMYNLALAKYHLGDHCGYCINMGKAADMHAENAKQLYETNCIKKDTIFYSNAQHPDSGFYSVIYIPECDSTREQIFYIKSRLNGEVTSFGMKDNILCKGGTKDYSKVFPALDEIIPGNIILTGVQEMPMFRGGDEERVKFIASNLQYPKGAYNKGIQGTVYLTFVVDVDGSITDVKVLRGIESSLDEEAVRLVSIMPKWSPGKVGNIPVRVQFNMPIRFIIAR
jgi:TonB family protein